MKIIKQEKVLHSSYSWLLESPKDLKDLHITLKHIVAKLNILLSLPEKELYLVVTSKLMKQFYTGPLVRRRVARHILPFAFQDW